MAITKISNDLIDLNQSGDFSGLRLPEGTTADREETFTTDYLVVGGGGGTSNDSPGGAGAGGLRTSYNNTATTTNSLNFPAGKTAIATYMLDNAATDISGNYSGTESNISYNTGKYGGGAVFNGSSSKIDLPNLGISGAGTRTISAWVNTNSLSSAQTIFQFGPAAAKERFGFAIDTAGKVYVEYYGRDAITSSAHIVINTWFHVAVTYNGGAIETGTNTQIYVNGSAVTMTTTGSSTGVATTGNSDYGIGYRRPSSSQYFNGSIDQVRIYDSELSSSDVSNIYTNEVQAPSGGGTAAESDLTLVAGTSYTVTVGTGGTSNTVGNSSVFSTITSDGGGRGSGGGTSYVSGNGASGGGGSGGSYGNAGGSGTLNQGYGGGTSGANTGGTGYPGGGGGGATALGQSLSGSGDNGGTGGAGLAVNILNAANAATASVGEVDSSNVYYAGGGGGSTYTTTQGSGGLGGGGDGQKYITGTATNPGANNTGGGAGGLNATGGSGVVILRYPTASVAGFTVTGTLNTPSTTDTIADNNYPTTNLAYYKLDGNATDSSGNGYNGTASSMTWGSGRFGQAGVFGGSGYITLSTVPFPVNNFTISAWMNVDAVPGTSNYNMILTTANSSSFFYFAYEGSYLIYYNNANGSITGGTSVAGVWQHCVLTQSSTAGATLYLDGAVVGSNAAFTADNTGYTGGQNTLGNYDTGSTTYPYSGKMDQVRIFASALSATQVTELYNESFPTKFTEGSDTILAFTKGTGTVTFSGAGAAPPAGSIRYNTTTKTVEFYNGAWVEAASTKFCTTNTLNFPAGTTGNAVYTLDNTVSSVGGTYTGTNNNVTFDSSGKYGASAVFNGTNAYIASGFTAPTSTTASISVWVKIAAYTNYGGFVGDSTGASATARFFLGQGGGTSGNLWVSVGDGSSSWYDETTVSLASYGLNTWFNLVGTVDGTAVKIYINGSLIQSFTSTVSYTGNGQDNYYFGSWGSSLFLNGEMDQIRFFGDALTLSQVQDLYNNETEC